MKKEIIANDSFAFSSHFTTHYTAFLCYFYRVTFYQNRLSIETVILGGTLAILLGPSCKMPPSRNCGFRREVFQQF